MAKFQLTISDQYVPTWGIAEGLREAVQNALDGQQAGYPMEITAPTKGSPVLRISNKGVTLDRSIWLMGTTSKASGDYRGCYGEGLKLGALALTRAGRSVTFANGAEDWRVKLEPSKAFEGKPVVTVYTVKRKQPVEDFAVSIDCTPEEWAVSRLNFLDLLSDQSIKSFKCETSKDRLLLDPAFAGRLYVKGILVEAKENMAYGYDFGSASVDRDRRMINTWDLGYHTSGVWSEALLSHSCPEVNGPMMLDFLISDTFDARCFQTRKPWGNARHLVEAAWFERYGEDTIPVANLQALNAAGHLGLTGVIMPAAVHDFFQGSERLDIDEAAKHRKLRPSRTYNLTELEPLELENFRCAVALVNRAIPAAPILGLTTPLDHRMEVVDFSDDSVLGMHVTGEVQGRNIVRLARHILGDFTKLLEVLVHETAHDVGGDGSPQHQRAEGALYSTIVLQTLLGDNPCPEHLRKLDLDRLAMVAALPVPSFPSALLR